MSKRETVLREDGLTIRTTFIDDRPVWVDVEVDGTTYTITLKDGVIYRRQSGMRAEKLC